MKILLLILAGLWPAVHAYAIDSRTRCLPTDAPLVYGDDFALGCGANPGCGYGPADIKAKFENIYNSGKRLQYRAEYDSTANSYFLTFRDTQGFIKIPITEQFIQNVTIHIETALEQDFAEYVMHSDMGHSHLYFPEELWSSKYKGIKDQAKLYEAMFADPSMKVLYHLSENVLMLDSNKKVIDDETVQFKFRNRNLFVNNDGSKDFSIPVAPEDEGSANTVRTIEGYKRYSGGFLISASINGCFPYKDKNGTIHYFDISLHSLPYLDAGM